MSWSAPPLWAAGSDNVQVYLRIGDFQPPDAITNLSGLPTGTPGEVQLNWTAPPDKPWNGSAAAYFIKRATYSVDSLLGDTTAWWDNPLTVDVTGEPVPAGSGTAQSLTLSSLQLGVTHWFAIRSTDTSNFLSLIDTNAGTPGSQAFVFLPSSVPATPSLSIDLLQTTTVQIRWELTDNADNETALYVTTAATTTARLPIGSPLNLGPLAGTGGTTGYIQTGLTPNISTTVYAEASNAAGSSFSAAVTRYTLANPPLSLASGTFSTSGGTLTWSANNNPGSTPYFVERSTALNGVFAQVGSNILNTTFVDSGLVEGSTFVYRVFARNGDGVATSTSNAVTVIVPRIAPDPITDLAAASGSAAGSIELTWTATGDDGPSGSISGGRYRIDYSTDSGAAHLNDTGIYQIDFTTNVLAGSTQRYLLTGLTRGATYFFRVYTLDEGLNVSTSNAASAMATEILDTTPPRVTAFTPRSAFPGIMPTDVWPNAELTVTFDEPMDASTLAGAFRLTAIRDHMGGMTSQNVTGVISYSGLTLTFQPNPALTKNFTYRMELSTAAKDLAGNALAETFTAEFRVYFDHTIENYVYAGDGRTFVRIPPGTYGDDAYIRVSTNPLTLSFESLSALIQKAQDTEKARRGANRAPVVETLREFQLFSVNSQSEMSQSAQRPMTMFLPYDDPDDDGYLEGTVDGIDYKIHERFMGVVTLNERSGLWVIVPGANVDTDNNRVSVPVSHFSVYGIMPVATNFVSDAFAYPVPFVPTDGHAAITFTNLAMDTVIRIYSVSGSLVRELHENDGDGQQDWDARNDDGEEVFSGVYLYVVTSGSEKKTGKLVIIR